MNKPDSKEVARQLLDLVNNMSFSSKNFVEELVYGSHTHRTLQQSVFRLMIDTMAEWSKLADSGRYDLRNEYTCKMSKLMLDALDEANYGVGKNVPHI